MCADRMPDSTFIVNHPPETGVLLPKRCISTWCWSEGSGGSRDGVERDGGVRKEMKK